MDELMPFVTGGNNALHKVKNVLVVLYGLGDETHRKIESLETEVADLRLEVQRLRSLLQPK